MRAFLGEYGKVIVCAIVILSIFGYCFTLKSGSVAASLPSPTVTVKSDDSFALVDDVSKRANPTITIPSADCKIHAKEAYDLMDPDIFNVSALNADGNALAYSVVKVEYPNGTIKNIDASGSYSVCSDTAGVLKVTYRTEENYNGRELRTEKTFQFVVD